VSAESEYWEGYQSIREEEVPAGTRWDEAGRSGRIDVAFGGPADGPPGYKWRAPFRRLIDSRTGATKFSRYVLSKPTTEAPDGD
jgi:hypothetical protein